MVSWSALLVALTVLGLQVPPTRDAAPAGKSGASIKGDRSAASAVSAERPHQV